jgi:hypothetical protein
MKHLLFITTKKITTVLIYLTLGGAAVLLTVFVLYLEGRPDLTIWHEAELDAEFTADSPVSDFSEYIQLEETLFRQFKPLAAKLEPYV